MVLVMKHCVATFREAGLEARWIKRGYTPFIAVRNPSAKLEHQRKTWWLVTKQMFVSMEREGIVEGFTRATLLGDIFAV
jgi:hypothetical protein